jgi:hypothetical protein
MVMGLTFENEDADELRLIIIYSRQQNQALSKHWLTRLDATQQIFCSRIRPQLIFDWELGVTLMPG